MSVEITVTWNFVGEDENAQVSYRNGIEAPAPEEQEVELPDLGNVLPQGSSVLAPGLSMPVPV